MKKVVLAGFLSLGLAASASAYDVRVSTALTGSTGATAPFFETYHNVGLGGSQLILGAQLGIPATFDKDRGVSFKGNIGLTVDTDLPVLSNFEITTDFGQSELGNVFVGQNLMIRKKYYAKLSDKVEIGISATLLSVDFHNQNVSILSTVIPVIAMTAKI